MKTKEMITRRIHPISPIFDSESRVLILGSFPSVKSREAGFYYAHPQNRFWKVIAAGFNSETPKTAKDKTEFLLSRHIALWDVIAECDISGSSDTSIRNVVPNDITTIADIAPIEAVFTNGKTASVLYDKYIYGSSKIKAHPLPSTSSANAAYSLDRLVAEWSKIREII